MSDVRSRKVKQIACTGLWLILLAVCVSVLGLYLKNGMSSISRYILNYGSPFWTTIPGFFAGITGIVGARRKANVWVVCFLCCCVISCCVGAVVSALMGVQMISDRSEGECKNVHCPYSLDAILMLLLIGLVVLQTMVALTGIVDGSILLYQNHTEALQSQQISNTKETDQMCVAIETPL